VSRLGWHYANENDQSYSDKNTRVSANGDGDGIPQKTEPLGVGNFVVSGIIVGGIFYYLRVRDQNEINVDQRCRRKFHKVRLRKDCFLH